MIPSWGCYYYSSCVDEKAETGTEGWRNWLKVTWPENDKARVLTLVSASNIPSGPQFPHLHRRGLHHLGPFYGSFSFKLWMTLFQDTIFAEFSSIRGPDSWNWAEEQSQVWICHPMPGLGGRWLQHLAESSGHQTGKKGQGRCQSNVFTINSLLWGKTS